MPGRIPRSARFGLLSAVLTASAITGSSRSASAQAIPPAPVPYHWADPAFEPDLQCSGGFSATDLERLLPMANVALQIPGTQQVSLDNVGRCIRIGVRSIGTGRLVDLVLRGMAVPRRAVLLDLLEPPSLRHS
jgi:hypothetical protein